MGVFVSLIAAGVLAVAGQVGPAQMPATPPTPSVATQDDTPATDLGTVEVTGQRPIEDRATAFVEEVAVAPRGRGLARWDRAICVGAANMNARYAQAMIDRVSAAALDLGLEIGEPGCQSNVMIAAAADADDLAAALIEDDPNGFRPATDATDLGRRALDAFRTSDAPVRWWHVSLPKIVDTGEVAVRLRGEDAQTRVVRDASRVRSNVRDDLARVIIILDTDRIGGVSFAALGDYVALIALAQVDPTADISRWPSVLNLFSADAPPAGLTEWDRDYLQALYAAPRDRARASQQARAIVGEMVEAQTDSTAPDEGPAEAPRP